MPNSEIIEVGDIKKELAAAGGGRLSKVGIVVGIVILAVVTVAIIRGLSVSGASTQTVTAQTNPQGDVAQDRAKVDELASYASAPRPTPTPMAAPSVGISETQSNVTRQTHSTSSGTPSAYQQWALEEEVKAFQAPPMVRQFDDHSTLELASKNSAGHFHPSRAGIALLCNGRQRIPALLITAINSDMPGPIIAQVSENVYDSATGQSLLFRREAGCWAITRTPPIMASSAYGLNSSASSSPTPPAWTFRKRRAPGRTGWASPTR
jgi:hypothetical protein